MGFRFQVAFDITEEIQAREKAKEVQDRLAAAEKSVRDSNEWLRLAMHGSSMGLWYWNELGWDLFWDAKTREIFNVGSDEAITLDTFYEALHPDDRERVKNDWRYQFEHGEPFDLEYRVVGSEGSVRWLQSHGCGYFDETGKPHSMFGVVFDITERKLTQEALSSMSGKLIEAHEQERTRIARELHDDISQRIPLITIYFEQLKRELPASDNGSALIVQQITGAPLKRTH